jgi:alkanesulfonate monooxygenase SsuD/methylene tetrahydromethanopterin reductase-like flavin-dependent oxidoreductase (luciferase family)
MRLGAIVLCDDDVPAFREQVRLTEELGYEVLGIGDSPAAWQDLLVSLTLAAQETERITLATAVTTPILRHPVALARGLLSVAELAQGRFVIGIGAGGSAPAAAGRTGATLREMREYILALRALLNGESITWDGLRTPPLARAAPLRIVIAADGPRQQRLAAELGDGVMVNLGMSLPRVQDTVKHVRTAAREAGRTPEEIELWGYTYASVRDRHADAVGDITAFLAVMGSLWMRRPYARRLVPPELSAAVERMIESYDPTEHVVVGGRMAQLVEELGLSEFLAGLCAVAGTPEEVGDALAAIEQRGIGCVLAALPGQADPIGTLHRFAAAAPASPT